MKKQDLIITIGFLFFLFVPNFIYFFVKDKMDNNNYENRELYSKPELQYEGITLYPRNYENYFNDHLAFKNEIRSLRSKILYNIFKTSSNERVLIGKNNWLFYNSAASIDGNSISDFQNITLYSKEEMETIKNNLVKSRDNLKNKNIDFYVFVIPNKENVYSDYMPKVINKSTRNNSKTEILVDYLKNKSDLNITYPKKELVESRKKYETYKKNDTHWNSFGAYIGVKKLSNNINSNIKIEKVKFNIQKNTGDLAGMNLMPEDLMINDLNVEHFMDDISVYCKDEVNMFVECESNNSNNKKILFIGDSFRTLTIPYLSKMYEHSYFVHRNNYNNDFIEKYNPDIIVLETVERYSYVLGNNLFE